MIAPGSSLIDGAFAVCTALDAAGFTAVLMTVDLPRREISALLAPLGFREEGRIYVHDAVAWTVDFPRGPLAVGRDIITTWNTIHRDDELLHVVYATDSVRDRFMHYWAWNDYSGLTQALAVAKAQRHAVDLGAICAWTDAELTETPVYDQVRRDHFLTELKRVLR